MPLLVSGEIVDAILSEVKGAHKSVQIITAYLKRNAFTLLNNAVDQNVSDKKLLVRMRMDDILKGSSDFEAIEFAFDNGWKVYLRFDLHAKTYVIDNKRCIIGSANVTSSGLSLSGGGNAETATLAELDDGDIYKINRLYMGAVEVNRELLVAMKKELNQAESHLTRNEYQQWSSMITNKWRPEVSTLFSYELPDKASYKRGEHIAFLECDYESDMLIRKSFRWSNAYLWLEQLLKDNDGCLYFGAITKALHDALVSDPPPYRKDVKVLLANLLNLIEEFQMDEIVIDIPNYSQRVRLK